MSLGKIEVSRWLTGQDGYDEPAVKITIQVPFENATLDVIVEELDACLYSIHDAIVKESDRRNVARQIAVAQMKAAMQESKS